MKDEARRNASLCSAPSRNCGLINGRCSVASTRPGPSGAKKPPSPPEAPLRLTREQSYLINVSGTRQQRCPIGCCGFQTVLRGDTYITPTVRTPFPKYLTHIVSVNPQNNPER